LFLFLLLKRQFAWPGTPLIRQRER